jgi:hypothetical protein
MPKKCAHKVADWSELKTRIDPETQQKFRERLRNEGKTQSHVIRKLVRNWATGSE